MKRFASCFQCIALLLAAFGVHAASPSPPDLTEQSARPRLQIQVGHRFSAKTLAWSPNSLILASGGGDKNINLWMAETGRLLRQISGHNEDIIHLAFSPTGERLGSVDESGVAKVWETATGKQVATLGNESQPTRDLAYVSDGSLLVVGKSGLQRWGPSMAAAISIGVPQDLSEVRRLCHTRDGSVLAVAGDSGLGTLASPLAIWDQTTNSFVALGNMESGREGLRGMALSRDGQWLAVSFGDLVNTRLELWDVTKRLRVTSLHLGKDERVDWLEFDASGRLLGNKGEKINHNYPSGVKETVFNFRLPDLAASPLVAYEPVMSTFPVDFASLNPSNAKLAVVSMAQIQIINLNTGASTDFKELVDTIRGLDFPGPQQIRVMQDSGYTTWNFDSRTVSRTRWGKSKSETLMAVSPDGRFAVIREPESYTRITLQDLRSGKRSRLKVGEGVSWRAVFSADSKLVAIGAEFPDGGKLVVFDIESQAVVATTLSSARRMRFSSDHRVLYFQTGRDDAKPYAYLRWDFRGTDPPRSSPMGPRWPIATSKDGTLVALIAGAMVWVGSADGTTHVRGLPVSGAQSNNFIRDAAFSPDARMLASANEDGTVSLYSGIDREMDAASGQTKPAQHRVLTGHSATVLSVRFSLDGKWLASFSEDGTTLIWDVVSGAWVARLIQAKDGSWIVMDPTGRFDTNNLENNRGIQWIMPDDPSYALPPEIFMRDYFEPRLLQKLLSGEALPQLPALDRLNRVQARIAVISVDKEGEGVSLDGYPNTVSVIIEVSGDRREYGPGNAKQRMATGVYDLRLFRDRQLVGQWPPEPVTMGAMQTDRNLELAKWRSEHRVMEFNDDASKPQRIVFRGIRLPHVEGKDVVEFSAYGFNVDRVKSETIKWNYKLPFQGLKPRMPRAYIVTIGVNAFDDSAWNLKYAANDAQQFGSELTKRLQALVGPDGSKHFEKVVWVPLVSDADKSPAKARRIVSAKADKKHIEAVLKTLGGQAVDPDALADIRSAPDIRRVNPEDLVIIMISTHGLNDEGSFYFLPTDIGAYFSPMRAPSLAVKAEMLARAVSNDELAQWLRGVDAVDQVMIIDACHSAASVQNAEFKPGPMGSRGLGQLAYDQGMRILAATQVEQDAVDGTAETRMGLLVYTLIAEGLRAGKADNAPADGDIMLSEWLNYGNARVPGVFRAILDRKIKGTKGTVEYSSDPKVDASWRASIQQPSLFDFSTGSDLPLVLGTKQP